MNNFNEQSCRDFFNMLSHDVTEIRLIHPDQKEKPQSLFVIYEDEFVKTCEENNTKYQIYAGINERHPNTRGDKNVKKVKHLFLDVDPKRPHGTSATEEQKQQALSVVKKIVENEYENPLIIDSGNGYHIYWKIPEIIITEENREEISAKKKKWEERIRQAYQTENVSIDSIYNLERILKIPGTLSIKGEVHRVSDFVFGYHEQKENEKLKKELLSYEVEEVKKNVEREIIPIEDEELKLKIKENLKLQSLLDGNIDNYKSRSEAEQAIMNELVRMKISKEQIWKVFYSSKTGKWQEGNDNYKQITYDNAIKWIAKKENDITNWKPLPKIRLPTGPKAKTTITIGAFAKELGEVVAKTNEIFFKPALKCAVELRKFTTNEEEEYLGFGELKGLRFVTLAEEIAYLYSPRLFKDEDGTAIWKDVDRNMTTNIANLTIASEQFMQKLNPIKRIFTIPIPIIHDGEMTFPNEKYDSRFQSWLDPSDVKLEELPVKEAKNLIHSIFDEFCFERDDERKLSEAGNQSRTHAIAGLITPFLRGLYTNFNVRTPLFFYLGNRSRVGKDYCAAMTGLLYEGVAIEEPPIATGKRNASSNEELRKKIMAVILRGRRRLHFSNNKGMIDSAMLENIITSKTFSDRLLGGNETATFDNELEFSMSGNVGVTFTPDLANRSRFINLFLDVEDPNSRVFQKPDLHKWVIENRSLILSSIYTLVKTWYDAGAPKGETPYTSFPEWAEICGGVMKFHGFGNPCLVDKSEVVGDCDEETTNMKKLFELLYQVHGEETFLKRDIFRYMIFGSEEEDDGWQEQYGLFGKIKFDDPGGKASFSKKFKSNVNRIYSDLKLKIDPQKNTTRTKFYLNLVADKQSVLGGDQK